MASEIKFDMTDVTRKLGMLRESLRTGLVHAVADWLRLLLRTSFQDEQSPEGAPWAPLTPAYARTKKRGRRILEASGGLFNQVINSVTIDGASVFAGSTLRYAAIHQFGGTIQIPEIRPKKANGVLRWFGPDGKPIFARVVKAHTVHIPARPFLPSPEFAEKQAAEVCNDEIQRQIDEAGAGAAPGKAAA